MEEIRPLTSFLWNFYTAIVTLTGRLKDGPANSAPEHGETANEIQGNSPVGGCRKVDLVTSSFRAAYLITGDSTKIGFI